MGIPILIQLEYLLRIVVATLCGAIIGYERSSHLKTAGIRTHVVVSVAASLMMLVSKYGFYDMLGKNGVSLDPSRIAAGVVTAVGFLGAGVIFVRKSGVSGVTTSAGLWATVGVGMAVGAGMYLIGVFSAVLIVLLQVLLHRRIGIAKETTEQRIILDFSQEDGAREKLTEMLSARRIEVMSFRARKLSDAHMRIRLVVRYPEHYSIGEILRLFAEMPQIQSVEV